MNYKILFAVLIIAMLLFGCAMPGDKPPSATPTPTPTPEPTPQPASPPQSDDDYPPALPDE